VDDYRFLYLSESLMHCRYRWLIAWTILLLAKPVTAEAENTQVTGATISQCVAQLEDEDRTIRCRAVRTLGVFEQAAAKPLTDALSHSDPAVRYLAAVHLGRIGGVGLKAASDELAKLADDEDSKSVQMAAAFALCRAGKVDEHLSLLIERLKYPERAMACSAAELIGNIGPAAARAISALEKAQDENQPGGDGDYHLGGAAKAALRKVQPESP
jgi:HEAT repeat protein